MHQEFATVASYSQAWEAHLARNLLEQNGIRAFIADENSAIEGWSNFVETKVQVAAVDA